MRKVRRSTCAREAALIRLLSPSSRGIADLQIVNPCRKGAALSVKAGQLSLGGNFDQQGKAQLRIPLFQEATDIAWTAGDGTTKTETVRVAYPVDSGRSRCSVL